MRVAGPKGLDAGEVGNDATLIRVEGLVELEVVRIAMNQRDLAREGQRGRLESGDVVGERVVRPRVRKVLLVVEV